MTTPPKSPAKPTTGSLADALLAFQGVMPKVGKNKTAVVPTKAGGQYKYTYADLADVSDAAIPLLNGFGITFSCKGRRCDDGNYELVGILRHAPSGEVDESSLPLFGRTAQEIGGSITYNRRYLLGLMTGIITDDDVDAPGAHARAAQPSALEVAQSRVRDAYSRYVGGTNWAFSDLAARYNSDTDRNVGTASVGELNDWADSLEAEMAQRGAETAVQAAGRSLGATPSSAE